MATITTDTFLDDGTARTAGEAWTINGGILTIRTDTRYHAGSPASMTGTLGSTTISATLGGGILLDGRNVREVWFGTGTGTVPAIGTAISQGGVSGYLLGVYASLTSAPTTVGAAMPVTGFIKFREVTGGVFAAGALTGIGAVSLGADTSSWIEVVQRQLANNTVPRLGFYRTRGTWYMLQELTTGVASQIIQIPTNGGGAGTHVACIWIETGVATNVWEPYPAVGSTYFNSTNLGVDARSKFVHTIGNGQVRIGFDGTNNVGFVPAAGARIRIPNVIGRQCTLADGDSNNLEPHATLTTRPDFSTTASGNIDFEYFLNDWSHLFSSPNNVKIKHTATFDSHLTSNESTPTALDDYHNGVYQGLAVALSATSNAFGGTVSNCKFTRGNSISNGHAITLVVCSDYIISNCHLGVLTYARATGRSINMSQSSNCNISDIFQYNSQISIATSSDITVTNVDHCDRYTGNTNATSGIYAISTSLLSTDVLVDGITFGLLATISDFCNPYNGIFNPSATNNSIFRNAGTRSVPLLAENETLAPAYISIDSGNNFNIKIQRCYMNFTRTSLYVTLNTSNRMTLESLHGSIGTLVTAAQNSLVKGVRATANSVAGSAAVYGTHYFDMFTSDTTGRIWFAMNEPTVITNSYVILTLAGASGGFTSGGQVSMPTVGDVLTIETSYFAVAHTAFQNVAATLTGTNTGNISYEYDIDTGSGFSTIYKTLDGANLSAEVINPAVGVRLKLKLTTTVASTTNAITYVRIDTDTTLLAQTNYLYPLDSTTLTVTGLRAGSRVQIYDTTNSVEIYNDVVAGTSLEYTTSFMSTYNVRIRAMYATSSTADEFIEFTDTVTSAGISRSVNPVIDTVYVNNAVDGFSVTGLVINDTALLIEADDGTFSWSDIYAFETAWLFSEEGIRDEGRFITAIDSANYLLDNFKIKNTSSPTAPLILINGWGRDSVTNQTITLIDTSGGSIFSNPDLVISYATGSGLSPSEQATLAKIDTLTEDVGGVRFTAQALEQGSGLSSEQDGLLKLIPALV